MSKKFFIGTVVLLVVFAAHTKQSFGDESEFSMLAPSFAYTLQSGQIFQIAWSHPSVNDYTPISEWTNILLTLRQGGSDVLTIGTVSDVGYYNWIVPDGLSGSYTIYAYRATLGDSAESEVFGIRDSSIRLIGPAADDEAWLAGSIVTVSWIGDSGSLSGIDVVLVATDGTSETVTIAYAVDPVSSSIQISLSDNLSVKPYEVQLRDSTNPLSSPIARTAYTIDVRRNPGPYQDGALLREVDSDEVWLIKTLPNGKEFRRHVLTWDMAKWYTHIGDFWSAVNVVPNGTLERYLPSAWVRLPVTNSPTTWKVFEVNDDATKHWLTCASADYCAGIWRANGGDPDGVYTVNSTELNFYKTGLNVFYDEISIDDIPPDAE